MSCSIILSVSCFFKSIKRSEIVLDNTDSNISSGSGSNSKLGILPKLLGSEADLDNILSILSVCNGSDKALVNDIDSICTI